MTNPSSAIGNFQIGESAIGLSYTFLGLVQRLRQESGASGTGPVSTIGQTGELNRMVNWINDAWMDIQSLHQNWQFLRSTCSFPTVNAQAIYSPVQCNASDLGMWDLETFRNYANPIVQISIASPAVINLQSHGLTTNDTITLMSSGSLPSGLNPNQPYCVASIIDQDNFTVSLTLGSPSINTSGTQSGIQTATSSNVTIFAGLKSEIFLDPIPYDAWRDSYFYGNLRFIATRPVEIGQTPNKSLCLGPVPSGAWTIVGDYFKNPTYLLQDTDVLPIPIQYQMAIVWRALMSYGSYEEDGAVVARGERNYNNLISRMEINFLPNVRFAGALC